MTKKQENYNEAPDLTELALTEIDVIDVANYSKPSQQHWLLRRISILNWFRGYDREKAIADLIAGITVGLTIIPQSIAYAALAGLSSEYGLYTALAGAIMYVILGTIPQVSVGPTSVMCILTLQYCSDKPLEFVFLLAFFVGLVELMMGILQMGVVISFIPTSVIKAFASGVASYIILVQLKPLFGLNFKGFMHNMEILKNISVSDTALGLGCCIALLSLRQLAYIKVNEQTESGRRLKKGLWLISISRNALAVFFCALFTYVWVQRRSMEAIPYALSSKTVAGLPSIKFPTFLIQNNNHTYSFSEIFQEIGSGVFVIPLIGCCANVAIGKTFIRGGNLNVSQEMLALGFCNLVGALCSGMPMCGAFTRSAVNQASGVRTPVAGIYTSIIIILALSVLAPYFKYIPKSTLAAVLIVAVVFMIDLKVVKRYWRANKKDFCSWFTCFTVGIVLGFAKGLVCGMLINIIFVLIRLSKPKVKTNLKELDGMYYVLIEPQTDVYYSGIDFIRSEIIKLAAFYHYDFPVVLDCSRFMLFDATFLDMLNATAKDLKEKQVQLILMNVKVKVQIMPWSESVIFCKRHIDTDFLKSLKEK